MQHLPVNFSRQRINLTGQVSPRPPAGVNRITNDRVTDGRAMNPGLVGPSGFQLQLQHCQTVEPFSQPPLRYRLPWLPAGDSHLFPFDRVPSDCEVDTS